MKRTISIIFIFLANVIILVHAVLPLHHCHHLGDRIVHSAIGNACRPDEELDCLEKGQTCHFSHQHDGCGDECQVSESFKLYTLTREKLFRNEWRGLSGEEGFSDLLPLFISFPDLVGNFLEKTGEIRAVLAFRPPVVSYLLDYVTCSLGLRSPTFAS